MLRLVKNISEFEGLKIIITQVLKKAHSVTVFDSESAASVIAFRPR